jgi:prepilin-type N-terminal cleavage/methylation domain-containing protein
MRSGFTLWELTMVLLVMAIAATLAAPAFGRLGTEQPTQGADQILGLLHDARKAAFDFNATVTLRLDPKSLKYQLDTATVAGTGTLAAGILDVGST